MTREQIEALSGSELDAEVAQRIMGWKPVPALRWMPQFANDKPSHWLFISPKYGELTISMVCWNPHRDIKDAWRVVEEMRFLGWALQLTELPDDWEALFSKGTQDVIWNDTEVAASICKAALLARMGEEKA